MAVCLDMYAQGAPDPAEAEALETCEGCGQAIYSGEEVYKLDDGAVIHADWECLYFYVNPLFYCTVEEALGEE